MKVRISAVIITYNEEHNIARCLESLREVAEEIVGDMQVVQHPVYQT